MSDAHASRDYVRLVANNFSPPPLSFEVLAQAGQVFPERAAAQPALGQMGDCFPNALNLALRARLHYVEGYAIAGDISIPLEHAWCVNDAGRVYDPTWPDGHTYFGMAFKRRSMAVMMRHSGKVCILGNLFLFADLGVDALRRQLLEAALPIPLLETMDE